MTTLTDVAEELKAIRAKIEKEGQSLLKKTFDEFFQKYPFVKSIRWAQYTPYFNDGEECIFSMHSWECLPKEDSSTLIPDPVLECMKEEEDCYGYGFHGLRHALGTQKEYSLPLTQFIKDFDELEAACKAVAKEVMQTVLGDHVMVEATPEGFLTKEYEHD